MKTLIGISMIAVGLAGFAEANDPGFLVYPLDTNQRTLANQKPSAAEAGRAAQTGALAIAASPGEFEPASLAVYPLGDTLSGVTLEVSDLKGKGSVLPASCVDPYVLKSWYAVDCNNVFGTGNQGGFQYWPEMLLRDDSILSVDHAAKRNILNWESGLPVIPDRLQPFDVPDGEIKQIWLTVRIPEDAEPGAYEGQVTVEAGGQRQAIPLRVTVRDIRLADPLDDLGIYTNNLREPGWEFFEKAVRNLAEHGINIPYINIPVKDPRTEQERAEVKKVLDVYAANGLLKRRAVIAFSQLQQLFWAAGQKGMDNELRGKIPELAANLKTLCSEAAPGVDWYVYGMDEKAGNPESYRLSRESGMPVFITGGNEEAAYRLRFTGMWWMFREMAGHCHIAHSKGFRYGVYTHYAVARDFVFYRLRAGFWLWNQPLDLYMPWQFFDSLDRDHCYGQKQNFYMVRPAQNGIINTIQWEGFREGVDDQRYAATLGILLEQARDLGLTHPLLSRADERLAYIGEWTFDELQAVPTFNSFSREYPGRSLDRDRGEIADLILEIQTQYPELHSRKLVDRADLAEKAYQRQLERTPLIVHPYPYGVDGYHALKTRFLTAYRAKNWEAAKPSAEKLKILLADALKATKSSSHPRTDADKGKPTNAECYLLYEPFGGANLPMLEEALTKAAAAAAPQGGRQP